MLFSVYDLLPVGAKLLRLKAQLQGKMRARREVARQKREEMFDLDNEEGFEGAEDEEDILDDEGEMSDKTDTDVEDEEEELDEEEGYGEQEEKVVGS